MSAEYTPTTVEVRERSAGNTPGEIEDGYAAFDRWFAGEIRKAQHEAFERGIHQADADIENGAETYTNPYEEDA